MWETGYFSNVAPADLDAWSQNPDRKGEGPGQFRATGVMNNSSEADLVSYISSVEKATGKESVIDKDVLDRSGDLFGAFFAVKLAEAQEGTTKGCVIVAEDMDRKTMDAVKLFQTVLPPSWFQTTSYTTYQTVRAMGAYQIAGMGWMAENYQLQFSKALIDEKKALLDSAPDRGLLLIDMAKPESTSSLAEYKGGNDVIYENTDPSVVQLGVTVKAVIERQDWRGLREIKNLLADAKPTTIVSILEAQTSRLRTLAA